MINYTASSSLEEILKAQGFEDYGSEQKNTQNLRVYKLGKTEKKSIVLSDQIIIKPEGISVKQLSENELKIVLLYFHLISSDFKEISPKGKLNIENSSNVLSAFLLKYAQEQATERKSTQKIKLERIFETLTKVEASLTTTIQ